MQTNAIANPLVGPRSEPAVFRSAANDLAVVIDQERRRRGLGIYQFGRQLGMSDSRIASFSRFLRGDDSSFGYLAAVRLAERIGIPMVLVVGDEAREVA